MLLTNKPTNKQTNPAKNITFLVEVIKGYIVLNKYSDMNQFSPEKIFSETQSLAGLNY